MQTSRRASCQRTSAGGGGEGGEEGEESVAASYLLLEHAHTPQALDNQQKMPLTHSNIAAN